MNSALSNSMHDFTSLHEHLVTLSVAGAAQEYPCYRFSNKYCTNIYTMPLIEGTFELLKIIPN